MEFGLLRENRLFHNLISIFRPAINLHPHTKYFHWDFEKTLLSQFIIAISDAAEFKERLVATVKKEVKQVMEEAVTKKFVHEQSASVTSLCAAVEACLSQGLRRRALGLFKTSSTTALLHKVAKHCPEANYISKKVLDIENIDPTKRSSSSSDSTNKPPILKKNSNTSITPSASPPPQTIK